VGRWIVYLVSTEVRYIKVMRRCAGWMDGWMGELIPVDMEEGNKRKYLFAFFLQGEKGDLGARSGCWVGKQYLDYEGGHGSYERAMIDCINSQLDGLRSRMEFLRNFVSLRAEDRSKHKHHQRNRTCLKAKLLPRLSVTNRGICVIHYELLTPMEKETVTVIKMPCNLLNTEYHHQKSEHGD